MPAPPRLCELDYSLRQVSCQRAGSLMAETGRINASYIRHIGGWDRPTDSMFPPELCLTVIRAVPGTLAKLKRFLNVMKPLRIIWIAFAALLLAGIPLPGLAACSCSVQSEASSCCACSCASQHTEALTDADGCCCKLSAAAPADIPSEKAVIFQVGQSETPAIKASVTPVSTREIRLPSTEACLAIRWGHQRAHEVRGPPSSSPL